MLGYLTNEWANITFINFDIAVRYKSERIVVVVTVFGERVQGLNLKQDNLFQ